MRAQAREIVEELTSAPPPLDAVQIERGRAFLTWLADDHFAFLGYREYHLEREGDDEILRAVPGTGLGILRADQDQSRAFAKLPEAAKAKAREKTLLVLSKANSRATVHRPAYLDYVGVKTFDENGEVKGERRFLGLLSSAAYTESITRIPLLREKAADVLARIGVEPHSHAGKSLMDTLETYPRDEIFHTPGRGAGRGHPGRAADRRPPPAARLRPPRDLRPLRLRALLPAPRPLQHGRPRAVLADPARPLPRRERRVQRQDERVDDRPRALRRAPAARGRDPRRRRRRPRADVHRRVPLVARRLRQRDRDRVRRGPRRAARPQVRRLVPRGLQGGLHRDHGRAGRGPAGGHRDRPRHRHLAVLAARRRSRGGAPQGVPRRLAAVAVAGAADADLDGRRGPRRAAVRARRARPADVRLRVRPPVRTRAARPDARPVPGRHPGGLGRLQRDRRVQLPRPRRRADLAAGDRAARVREVHEAGQLALRRRLHRGGAARQHRHRAAAVAAVRGAVRPGEERPRRPGRGPHRPGRGDRGADQARAGRRGQPRPRPDPALVPHPHQGDPAHQLLPGRRVGVRRPAPLHVVQARAVGDPRPARASAAVRDLRVLPARRGRAPAVRRGGPRWPALVRPSRRLPHRGARPGQGADGQEHRDRPGGRQGRVLLQAAARPEQPRGVAGRGRGLLPHVHLRPARHHRQPRRGRERAADGRGPSRRRRLLPRGGRRQGHRDVQRHRQRRGQGLRLLAG